MRRAGSAHAWLTLAGMALAIAWSLFLVLPHLRGEASLLDRIEAPLTDLRFQLAGPRPAPESVALVAIDDETVRQAGGYPIPRAYLARLLERLAALGPKAVAVDILFLDPGDEAVDQRLGEALKALPSVIGMAATFERSGPVATASVGPFSGIAVADRIERPIERLAFASRTGLVNITKDQGGTPRHVPLLIVGEGSVLPALSLQAVMLAGGRTPGLTRDTVTLGSVEVPVDVGSALAMRFYGPQGSIRTVSGAALMDGQPASKALGGRIVVVGVTALGSGDTVTTPYDPILPGAELLATAIGHLSSGDALIRTSQVRWVDAGLTVALPVLVILLVASQRVVIGLAVAALLVATVVALNYFAFSWNYWLSLSLPLAGVAGSLPPYVAARLWVDRRYAAGLETAREALLRFHPPALAARLESDPGYLDEPIERDVPVIFLDLSGFTTLSERLGPTRTRTLLKEMHDLVEDIATERGGSVTSFMGDGAMILFGLPVTAPDDADRAVDAVYALAPALSDWLALRTGSSSEGFAGVRIGAHFGPVVVSRLGGSRNQHITATGDTVNTASRLLEIAKHEHAAIILSAVLVAAMQDSRRIPEPAERKTLAIRGRSQSLDIVVPARPAS